MDNSEEIPLSQERSRVQALPSTIGCFLLNTAALILGATIYATSSAGTWDHFLTNLIMGSLEGVPIGLVLSGLMLIPFLVTDAILTRRRTASRRRLWLCGPSLVAVVILLAMAFWTSLPRQRLKTVAKTELRDARNISVTAFTGFLAGDWVATCQISETSFLDYCQNQSLKPEEQIDILDKLKNRSLIRTARLVSSLPAFNEPLQYSRLEGDNQRHGVFAMYDRATSTMVIYRYFHD